MTDARLREVWATIPTIGDSIKGQIMSRYVEHEEPTLYGLFNAGTARVLAPREDDGGRLLEQRRLHDGAPGLRLRGAELGPKSWPESARLALQERYPGSPPGVWVRLALCSEPVIHSTGYGRGHRRGSRKCSSPPSWRQFQQPRSACLDRHSPMPSR